MKLVKPCGKRSRLETGDYGLVYDALYETLVNGQPNYVKESDVLTNMGDPRTRI
ncbi:Uncharacterized oxidoreductase yhhX [Raoultella planticola]|uniref:Uncharacterized oxidoreductase yhhX n=1 Tax=Raoultella planticola TaxID=575 RepID=A0A485CMV6_RAOPL|nr:Uncharacterized oxidoreductase yhhX [Raoultella planticola]